MLSFCLAELEYKNNDFDHFNQLNISALVSSIFPADNEMTTGK